MSITEGEETLPAPRHPGGRPTVMTPEVKREIVYRMAEGRSLVSICSDEDMPHRATVLRYLADDGPEHTEFRDRYTRAILYRTNALAEQALEIAFDESHDYTEHRDSEGNPYVKLNPTAINRARLKCDELHWHIERLNGQKYGKPMAIETEVTEQDRQIIIEQVNFDSLPEEVVEPKRGPSLIDRDQEPEEATIVDEDDEP
jgi:hypothetical protein